MQLVKRLVSDWVSQSVSVPLRFSLCEPLLFEAGSSGTGIVREPRVNGTPAIGGRYQATTNQDTADCECCCSELYSV
jgi:hypothetical protein